jgi:predicted TIM-barrel fold metal-dependent hydrolase
MNEMDQPLIFVTTDSHIGPRLKEDLRAYCPRKYLAEFDDFIRAEEPNSDPTQLYGTFAHVKGNESARTAYETSFAALKRNATPGHHDVHERLRDLDRDGVAAEVIFHGSQNGQCFPFMNPAGGTFNSLVFSPIGSSAHDLELVAVGQRMYNQWLADQCSVEPERHVGLAHLPMWDIESATRELEWAHSVGLRGVNFPAPKLGIKPYDDLAWEPFWASCEERGMVLCTHDGSGIDDISVARPHTLLAGLLEGDLVRKLFPRVIFGGMFERYPNLKLVLTELQQATSAWWPQTANRYDELWAVNRGRLGDQVPRPPSEYMASNVFLGQSLLHALPSEVTLAIRDGYAPNIMWGSDYPHQEGVYRHPTPDDTSETRTRLGLRNAFSLAPPELAKGMAGEHAVSVYGLDRDKLAATASRIGALTARELLVPLDAVPDEWAILVHAQNVFPEYHVASA